MVLPRLSLRQEQAPLRRATPLKATRAKVQPPKLRRPSTRHQHRQSGEKIQDTALPARCRPPFEMVGAFRAGPDLQQRISPTQVPVQPKARRRLPSARRHRRRPAGQRRPRPRLRGLAVAVVQAAVPHPPPAPNPQAPQPTKTPSPPQAARTPSKARAPALAPRQAQNRAAAPLQVRLLTRPRPWRRPTNRFPLLSSRLHRQRVRCNRRLRPSCRPNQPPARTPQPVGPVAPAVVGWVGAREVPAAVARWVAARRPVLPRRAHPHRPCRSLPQARRHPLHPPGRLAVVREPTQQQPPDKAGQESTRRPRDATMPAR